MGVRLWVVVAAVVLAPATARASQAAPEYDVKAAFLLNFSRYVQWPTARVAAPFRLCVLAPDPFGPRLPTLLEGESWQGAPMAAVGVRTVSQGRGCHLVFVPASSTGAFLAEKGALTGRGVLTVGETDRFLSGGGMIQLYVDEGKVRFSINQRAAESEGLQVSSRLLRLARSVIGQTTIP